MIGIGVFTSLGFQVQDIPSPFALLMLWTVGGLTALCGALCYAELAAAFPRSGGEYNFLQRTFGPAVGFLAGWISATVGFAAPVALAAMAFGGYLHGVLPEVSPLFAGLAVVWLVTLIHLNGVRHGSSFQNISTILKVVLILVLIVAGFTTSNPQPVSFAPASIDLVQMASMPFAISLVFVLYSYSGWNAATYIAGEVQDPERALPRAILVATLIVAVLYIGLNAAFLYTTPASEMSGKVDVGLIAGQHIFGDTGGRIVGALICLGLVSSISAMTWIGPRVTMVMGEDIPMLRVFSRKTDRGVPAAALLFQFAMVHVLIFSRSFEAVLDYIQFSLTFCSFLTVLGVMLLRVTQPNLVRPYRTWGYPVTPIVFLSVTLFVMYYLVVERPMQSLAGLVTMLAGLAIYAVTPMQSSPRAA